jgi:MoxR-like ATPase
MEEATMSGFDPWNGRKNAIRRLDYNFFARVLKEKNGNLKALLRLALEDTRPGAKRAFLTGFLQQRRFEDLTSEALLAAIRFARESLVGEEGQREEWATSSSGAQHRSLDRRILLAIFDDVCQSSSRLTDEKLKDELLDVIEEHELLEDGVAAELLKDLSAHHSDDRIVRASICVLTREPSLCEKVIGILEKDLGSDKAVGRVTDELLILLRGSLKAEDSDWVVHEAMAALVAIANTHTLDPITDEILGVLTGHDDRWLCEKGLEAAARLHRLREEDDRVLDALVAMVGACGRDAEMDLQRAVLNTLRELGSEGSAARIVEGLLSVLEDRVQVDGVIVGILADLGFPPKGPAVQDELLATLSRDEAELRRSAVEAFGSHLEWLDIRVSSKLLELLSDPVSSVRLAVASVISSPNWAERAVLGQVESATFEHVYQQLFKEDHKEVGSKLQQLARMYVEKKGGVPGPDGLPIAFRRSLDDGTGESNSANGDSLAIPDFGDLQSQFNLLCGDQDLVFHEEDFQRYHAALWANPDSRRHFVILAGPSGTGKTKLAQLYAETVMKSLQAGDKKVVAVRPEWTDARDLMGYFNPLKQEYISTEVLEFVLEAVRNPGHPHFLILDEMNLARVEYYFSDFLSAMESGEPLSLHSGTFKVRSESTDLEVPREPLKIPKNLFVTGTINVDETTHEISPKVLDRAHLLVLTSRWDEYYNKSPLAEDSEFGDLFKRLLSKQGGILRCFAAELDEAQLGFGYRTAEDILRFVNRARQTGVDEDAALDQAIASKVLPKIRGAECDALKAALSTLEALAQGAKLDVTAKHLKRMSEDLKKGFVVFRPI